jgi:hypothetical protein
MKKHTKNAFFLQNIWSIQKKAVPLHRFSADALKVEAKSTKDPPL